MNNLFQPDKDGRPWGCKYLPAEHQRAAEQVVATQPELVAWIKAHPEGLPDDPEMFDLLYVSTRHALGDANAKQRDCAAVWERIGQLINPRTEKQQRQLDDVFRRRDERAKQRRGD